MDIKTAINVYSQCDKIKSGLIWASQAVDGLMGLPEMEKRGALKVVRGLVERVGFEALLCRKLTCDAEWMNLEKDIDMARVMIDSGVPGEASFHLTHALTQVTTMGRRSMAVLRDQGLL